MSLLTLPEPANWRTGQRRSMRLTLIIGAFVAAAVFVGAHRLLLADYVGAVVSMGFLVPITLALIALQLVARGHTSMRAGHDSSGTLLRPDRTFVILILTIVGVAIPWAIAVLYFTLTGEVDLTGFRGGRLGMLILASIVLTSAVAGLLSGWRRGGIGHVKLTPSGIDIADLKRTETVAWTDVTAVADQPEANKKTRKAIVLRLEDGTEKTIDVADLYVPNGVGLYWMVWHYWRHADDRAELADGRALERLRDGRFDISVP